MIYAVNKRTKEHRRYSHRLSWSEDWYLEAADAEGWIEWHGGECPLPDGQRYEVKNRDGEWGEGVIGKWVHGSYQRSFDIIAYRPILGDDTKPEPPAWDGEGLPPVGCECECSLDFDSPKESSNWHKIEVLYADKSTVVGRIIEGLLHAHFSHGFEVSSYKFRPIRSEEDRAIEAMREVFKSKIGTDESIYEALYQAIRDGKVTGVKLTGGE